MDDFMESTFHESVTEYKNDWFEAGYDRFKHPDGSEKKYYWATLDPAVAIVAIKDTGNLLFVEQDRPIIKKRCTEVPAGMVEDDETYEEAAIRELEEETGYKAACTELLETYNVATGILQHERGIVVATELSEGEQNLDENEFLETHEFTPTEAIKVIRNEPTVGINLDALFVAALEGYIELPELNNPPETR